MSPFNQPKTLLSIAKCIFYKHLILFAKNTEDKSVRRKYKEFLKKKCDQYLLDLMLNELLAYDLSDLIKYRILDMLFDQHTTILILSSFHNKFINPVFEIIHEHGKNLIYADFHKLIIPCRFFQYLLRNCVNLKKLKYQIADDPMSTVVVVVRRLGRNFVPIIEEFYGKTGPEMQRYCSNVRKMRISQRLCGKLECLSECNQLRHLSLHRFCFNQFKEYFLTKANCTERLQYLNLSNANMCSVIDLQFILSKCANLKKLEAFSGINFTVPFEKIQFPLNYPTLEELYVTFTTKIPPDNIKAILTRMPNLKRLKIIEWRKATHHHIEDLVTSGCWRNMQLLEINHANKLTVQTVWMLIENCPYLKHIHETLTWNLTVKEYKEVESKIKNENINCCLKCEKKN